MNKQGYSTGFGWIMLIIFLFGFGLAFIVLNQVMHSYIEPMAGNLLNSSTMLNASERLESQSYIDTYADFWQFTPYIIFFVILLAVIYGAIRNQNQGG